MDIPVRHSASGPYVLAPVKVNGVAATFLVDTGSTHTMLAKAFADRIELEPVADRKASMVDAAGAEMARPGEWVKLVSLRIGSLRVAQVRDAFPVVDLANLTRLMGENVDGVLGNNILASTDFILNAQQPSFVVAKRIGLSKSQSAQDLVVSGLAMYLPIAIAGKPFEFRLDTGSNVSSVTQEVLEAVAPGETHTVELQQLLLESVDVKTFQHFSADVYVAGAQIADATLLVAEKNVLGLDLLRHGELRVSARDRRFEFRRTD
jgi:predicted aspartyl protease